MRIETFRMERMQCVYEKEVAYDLSESGVDAPVGFGAARRGVAGALPRDAPRLPALRRLAGAARADRRLVPGATAENVTVVNGGAEANHAVLWSLLEPRQRAAILLPNYMQAWGLARHWASASAFHLRHDRRRAAGRSTSEASAAP